MALLHQAELRPSKIELLEGWASSQPWYAGEVGARLTNVASFRFDDPEGEVGIETLLVRAGDGPTMQVPLTYRSAPLAGGQASLIGTLEHSVLGTRWVYDGVGDPAYLLTAASTVVTGGHQADLLIEVDGEMVQRDPTAVVAGSGVGDASESSRLSAGEMAVAGDISVRFDGGLTAAETASMIVQVVRTPEITQPRTEPDRNTRAPAVLTGSWTGQPEPRLLISIFVL